MEILGIYLNFCVSFLFYKKSPPIIFSQLTYALINYDNVISNYHAIRSVTDIYLLVYLSQHFMSKYVSI